MSGPLPRTRIRARGGALHLIVFTLSALIGLFSTGGAVDAAKPLRPNAVQNRAARVKLYARTLRRRLASDPYPLIDLEVSLDRWKSAAQLIEGMDRAGVVLGAVTAVREETIQKAAERYPGRLIPLTTSATPKDWTGSGYLPGIRGQLEGNAFGIGKIAWRPSPSDKSRMKRIQEALGAIIHLSVEKRRFLLFDMPPDEDGLEILERQLSATPEARVVWVQAGRILSLYALPGYGHGLLRALSFRHPGLFFTLTQDRPAPSDSPFPRRNHLYDPGGALSPEWRALLESRVGHFTAGQDSSEKSPAIYARRTLFFREHVLANISPPARKRIAYQNAWRLLTNRNWQP